MNILYFRITPHPEHAPTINLPGYEGGVWFASTPQVYKSAQRQLDATQAVWTAIQAGGKS